MKRDETVYLQHMDKVWLTAIEDLPVLQTEVAKILADISE